MKIVTQLLLAILLLFLLNGTSNAVCDSVWDKADHALWPTHNCRNDFKKWFRKFYNLQKSDWDEGWGWKQCDHTRAFPKMMNAAYVLTYGIQNGSSLGPWHRDADYRKWASGNIHEFKYEPEDKDEGAYASAFDGFWQTDRVEMNCPGFNQRGPAERAGTMLHESTHIIYWRWKHQSNLPGSNCSDKCSDRWLFHELGTPSYGSLNAKKSSHKHSMNQIQIEYWCDLSEFPEAWVPTGVISTLASSANNRIDNRILNPPGWRCGQPRPLPSGPDSEPIGCANGYKCCEPHPTGGCHLCVPNGAHCP